MPASLPRFNLVIIRNLSLISLQTLSRKQMLFPAVQFYINNSSPCLVFTVWIYFRTAALFPLNFAFDKFD